MANDRAEVVSINLSLDLRAVKHWNKFQTSSPAGMK
jgi:hypothetical protein